MLAVASELIDEERVTAARRSPRRPSVKARPFPASVILTREEKREGEGTPVLEADKAAEFYRRTVDAVEAALEEVFAGWEDLRP